jgi:hypothetical protein
MKMRLLKREAKMHNIPVGAKIGFLEDFDVIQNITMTKEDWEKYQERLKEPTECPLCKAGVPIRKVSMIRK